MSTRLRTWIRQLGTQDTGNISYIFARTHTWSPRHRQQIVHLRMGSPHGRGVFMHHHRHCPTGSIRIHRVDIEAYEASPTEKSMHLHLACNRPCEKRCAGCSVLLWLRRICTGQSRIQFFADVLQQDSFSKLDSDARCRESQEKCAALRGGGSSVCNGVPELACSSEAAGAKHRAAGWGWRPADFPTNCLC